MTSQNETSEKMSKWKKPLLLALFALVLVFVPLSLYKEYFSMTEIEMFEVLVDNPEHQILIASQGSKYKDALVTKLISQLKDRSIYLKVIDVSDLAAVAPQDWDAMVILHTWENWQPQADAEKFIQSLDKTQTQRVVVVTTSASGNAKMEGIDAITSASVISDVNTVATQVAQRLDVTISN